MECKPHLKNPEPSYICNWEQDHINIVLGPYLDQKSKITLWEDKSDKFWDPSTWSKHDFTFCPAKGEFFIKSTGLQILDRQDQAFNQGQMNRKAGPKRQDISIFI